MLKVSLHFLVNDIFMCFFFGLAIKEVTEALLPGGSLSPIRRATNPLMATLGGVVGPVAAYVIFVVIFYEAAMFNGILCESDKEEDLHRRLGTNSTEQAYRDCKLADFINGWGVPTATDISLAWMSLFINGSLADDLSHVSSECFSFISFIKCNYIMWL